MLSLTGSTEDLYGAVAPIRAVLQLIWSCENPERWLFLKKMPLRGGCLPLFTATIELFQGSQKRNMKMSATEYENAGELQTGVQYCSEAGSGQRLLLITPGCEDGNPCVTRQMQGKVPRPDASPAGLKAPVGGWFFTAAQHSTQFKRNCGHLKEVADERS
jgi:hypothetical protein